MPNPSRSVPNSAREQDASRAEGLLLLIVIGAGLLAATAVALFLDARIATQIDPQLHATQSARAAMTAAQLRFAQTAIAILAPLLVLAAAFYATTYVRRSRAAHQRLDATEHRRVLDALRASETRYASLVDSMGSAVAVYEAVDGGADFVIREFNRAAERVEKVQRAELLGRSVREVFPGVESFGIFQAFQRVYRTGSPERFPMALYKDERIQGWRDNYIYKLPSGQVVAIYTDETEHRQSESALQESEARFRTMFETAQDAIYVKDHTLRYTQVNPAVERLLGRPSAEVVGRTHAELFGEQAGRESEAVDRRVLAGEAVELEMALPAVGGPRTFHLVRTPLRNASGEVIGVCGIARDVTERRRADAQLLYQANLLQSVSDAIMSTDKDFRICSWNRGAEAIYGWSEAEALGKIFYELVPTEYSGETAREETIRELLQIGRWRGELSQTREQAIQALFSSGHWQAEVRQQRKDGTWIEVLASRTLLRDANGQPAGIVAVNRDVTGRNRARAALLESETRFRAITENAQEITFILSPEGRFAYVSPSVERIVGVAPAELIQRDAFKDLAPEYDAPIRALLQRAAAQPGERLAVPEFRALRRDGAPVYLEGFVVAMLDVPGIEGFVVSTRDVTERRRVEEELRRSQKLEAIGTLASGIAHDFNNILYAVIGYGELARDDLPEGDRARENVDQVLHAAHRATELVRRLLTFSSRTEQERQAMTLAPLIDDTLKLLKSTIPTTVEIESDIRPCRQVQGDPTQIQQLLINLCTNAYHAMRDSGGRLSIKLDEVKLLPGDPQLGPDLTPGIYAQVVVGDTGCGMPPATLERIFEPYFSTKSPSEGTGLGLAMVDGILRHHGGAVRVVSTVGTGSTFTVFLPLPGAQHGAPRGTPTLAVRPGGSETHIALVNNDMHVEFTEHEDGEERGELWRAS
jgi:PAS domain S-box-containing protein